MKMGEKIKLSCAGLISREVLKLCFAIATITTFSFSGASAGAIAHYRFEDGTVGDTITNIVNSSGNGNNGTPFVSGPSYVSHVPVATVPQTGQYQTSRRSLRPTLAASAAYPAQHRQRLTARW